MRFSRLYILLNLLGWLVCQPGFADIDPIKYEFNSAVGTEKERKRLTADFEVDKKSEAELRQQEEAEAAQKLAETYPAEGATGAVERLQQFGVLLSPIWSWGFWRLIRSRFHRRVGRVKANFEKA